MIKWNELSIGNIVRWSSYNHLWIVQEVDKEKGLVILISFSSSRCKAYPSKTWSEDPNSRVDSIEYICDNAMDLISKSIKNFMREYNIE